MNPESFDTDRLIAEAAACRLRAYAPYSGFLVGAALLCANGRVFTGCNVENSSYGLTICAERSAIAAAVAAGEQDYRAIAVVTDSDAPASPCGACRQVLVEFSPDMTVILANIAGSRRTFTARELLPELFRLVK